MADRIVVMDAARVVQIGTPREIYMRPKNTFVAGFVGLANIAPAKIASIAPDSTSFLVELEGHPELRLHVRGHPESREGAYGRIMFRPEAVTLSSGAGPSVNRWRGTVSRALFMGPRIECDIDVGGWTIRAEVPGDIEMQAGDKIDLHIDPARALWLPAQAESQTNRN